MRLGISSYTFTWAIGVPGHPPAQSVTAIDLLHHAHKLGVGLVQIADNLPLHKLSESELEAFAQLAQALNISIEVGTRGIEHDHLLTYLRLAERLGSPIVRTIVSTATHHPDVDEIVSTIKPMLREFESRNVTLAIENHDLITSPTLRTVIERLESPNIGICLDTVNSFGALEGPEFVIDTLAPYVVNLHVKEFVIYRASHMLGFIIEGAPIGKGRLNVSWLLNTLSTRQRERDFNAVLELWTPPDANIDDTIAKETAWAVESVAYLRQFIPD